jgi:gamma-glutamylputrescine oxidase
MIHNYNYLTNFSFWETETYFKNIELTVIGGGIVGLNAAISFKEKYKKAKVVIIERGILPSGASSKNAGFACFGSISELLSDLKKNDEDVVWQTLEMRIQGLERLRKLLGDKHLDYKELGGYEVFKEKKQFDECAHYMDLFNKQVKPYTRIKQTYETCNQNIKTFQFKDVEGLILNKKEGQIDTGLMIQNLTKLAIKKGVILLNSIHVSEIKDLESNVLLSTSVGEISSKRVIVATNGFATELLNIKDLKPARAQVLVTKPVQGLPFKGTFHYDEGFYYFRNIENRILLGGGRNLDFETETTTHFEINTTIHLQLEKLLKTMILPNIPFEIEQRWCGIMGIGNEKKPIIKKISPNIVCAVRMGGMGVAIGSLVGKLAVDTF